MKANHLALLFAFASLALLTTVADAAADGPSVIPVYEGKKAMVAITYDDGLLSHYTVARPMHAKDRKSVV